MSKRTVFLARFEVHYLYDDHGRRRIRTVGRPGPRTLDHGWWRQQQQQQCHPLSFVSLLLDPCDGRVRVHWVAHDRGAAPEGLQRRRRRQFGQLERTEPGPRRGHCGTVARPARQAPQVLQGRPVRPSGAGAGLPDVPHLPGLHPLCRTQGECVPYGVRYYLSIVLIFVLIWLHLFTNCAPPLIPSFL
jgi:hypothetical protein